MVGPGHAVLGTHAEAPDYAEPSLVVVAFVGVQMAEKVACDCCVVHTADNLAVVVVDAAVAAVHDKETAVAAAAAVAVIGDLEIDFPIKNKIKNP